MPDCELTVLLPCLNEAETLGVCIGKALDSLQKLNVVGEVVVADNGSTDGSQAIAKEAGARVVDIPRRGYGAALRGGIDAARGTYVLMADADDSYALDDLGPFVEAMRGGADIVMGNRFQGGIEKGAMPLLHRWVGNPILSRLGRLFFKIPVGDFHCGMRAFRRDKIQRLGLQTDGMEFASEMVVRASLAHLRLEEVPTVLRPDGRSRAPHLRTWRDGWRHLRFLLAFSPRWLFFYPAAALAVFGFVGLTILSFGAVDIGGVTFSVQTMLACAAALILGIQGIGLAVIARAYAGHLGLLPNSARLERGLERLTLDRGLVVGALLILLGAAAFIVAVINWGTTDFGQLDVVRTIRLPIIGMVFVVAGMQLMLVSFTLGLGELGEPPS
jgi:glycosyltransferase involved in cell wall biosynthesis